MFGGLRCAVSMLDAVVKILTRNSIQRWIGLLAGWGWKQVAAGGRMSAALLEMMLSKGMSFVSQPERNVSVGKLELDNWVTVRI